jgi:hypothetical protein
MNEKSFGEKLDGLKTWAMGYVYAAFQYIEELYAMINAESIDVWWTNLNGELMALYGGIAMGVHAVMKAIKSFGKGE